jgi:hypothetical protein
MKTIADLLENIDFDKLVLYTIIITTCITMFIYSIYILNVLRHQKKQQKESAEEQVKEQSLFNEIEHESTCKDKLPEVYDLPFLLKTPNPVIHDFQELEERTAPCHLTRLPSYAGQIVTFEAYMEIFLSPVRFTDKATFSIDRNTLTQLRAIAQDTGRKVSLAGLIENILRHHLKEYKNLINNATTKTLRKQTISDL